MGLFGLGKRRGRGLQIIVRVLPGASASPQSFTPLGCRLPKYFDRVTGNLKPGKLPYTLESTITCKDAKFELKPSEAEDFYTDLFYEYFADSLQTLHQLKQIGTILAGEVTDFAESVTFKPREKMEELIPIFPMRDIWGRLYVREFYDTYGRDRSKFSSLLQAKQNVLSKDDIKLLEQMITLQKDYRAFVSKHVEEIISASEKLGRESWEAGFRRDRGESVKAQIDTLRKQGAPEIIFSFAPLSQGDVSAVSQFIERMLAYQIPA